MNATPELASVIAETQAALRERVEGKSWRSAGEELGLSHGVLHSFATGRLDHVSWPQFAKIRDALSLPDLGEPLLTLPCPDCGGGGLHTGRCHGYPVARVIVKRRPPELPAWLRFATGALRELETQRSLRSP